MTDEQFSTACGCGAPAAPGEAEEPATTTAPAASPAATTPAPAADPRDLGTLAPAPAEAPTPAADAETFAPAQPVEGGGGGGEGDEEEEGGTAPATTTSAAVTSDTPNGLCGEVEQLTVGTSLEVLAGLVGCYEETGREFNEEGGHYFTETGSSLRGQMSIFPGYVDAQSTDVSF